MQMTEHMQGNELQARKEMLINYLQTVLRADDERLQKAIVAIRNVEGSYRTDAPGGSDS